MGGKTQFLSVPADAARGFPARKLAFVKTEGRGPCVIWLGGFRSDLTSTKAAEIDAACAARGRAMIRMDYTAPGPSEGDFAEATLSLWLDDAVRMIRAEGGQRPILVGSSMGGWIALLATLALRAAGTPPGGLVLIAPAVDFTERLMWAQFPEAIRRQIMEEGVWYRPSAYSPEPYPITRRLIEDARKHLLMGRDLRFGVPIHILQGGQDPDVPLQHVEAFMAGLPAEDMRFTLIPDGNHRLSRPEDIEALVRITLQLADEVEAV
jgi:pimeloyl-ACP methyl ester carboxylesterase